MSSSGEAAPKLIDNLKETEIPASSCQDHGDDPSDVEIRTTTPLDLEKNLTLAEPEKTLTLTDLEKKLRGLLEMQSFTIERNNALEAEIQQLREKREADKQKYKILFQGHEKYARMRAEYKQMSKFIKAHKADVEVAKSKAERQEAPQPESEQQQQQQTPSPPPPQPKLEELPQQLVEPLAIKRHAIRGEPCLTLTRSEVCRLEQDVLALRELLARREESWRRVRAREQEARKRIATLSTELATVRQLAQMRRGQSDELAHRLQEALRELEKHKLENSKLRNNVVRLRNRERSLLTSMTKKSKKRSSKTDRKKGRQHRKKSGLQRQTKSSSAQASAVPSHQGRCEPAPKGILRVQCCTPTRT